MRNLTYLLCTAAVLFGVACGDDDGMPTDVGVDSPMVDGGMDAQVVDGGMDAGMDGGMDGGMDEGEITRGRLVVADDMGNVSVLDLDEAAPAPLDTFALGTGVRLSGDINGRMVYLVQRDANLISILDSGVTFESHGDHFHINERDPAITEHTFTGSQPTHFVNHDGWLAAFYDGSGDVDVIQERTLLANNPVVNTLSTGVAHHGVAVVAHGHVLATVGTEGEALPASVGIWGSSELTGSPEMTAGPCPSLHGEAAAGEVVAFGCADGVLTVEHHGDHFDVAKIDNPAGTVEGTRVGRLIGHDSSSVMWGNYGSEGFVIIDPEAGTMNATMTDHAVSAFAFDMGGEHVFVLTVDGTLHRFLANGTADGTLAAIDAFEPGGHSSPSPRLVAGAGNMYLSVPATQQVLEIHIEDLEIERMFTLSGTPSSIAVVSVSPNFGHGHNHEH